MPAASADDGGARAARRAQIAKSTRQWRANRKAERRVLQSANAVLAAEVRDLAREFAALQRELEPLGKRVDDACETERILTEHALFIGLLMTLPVPSSEPRVMTRDQALAALDDCRFACLRIIAESQADLSFTPPQLVAWPGAKMQLSVQRCADGMLAMRVDWELRTSKTAADVLESWRRLRSGLDFFREMQRQGLIAGVPGRADKHADLSWQERSGLERSVEAVSFLTKDLRGVHRAFLTSLSAETHALSSLWPARCDQGPLPPRHGVAKCAAVFRTGAAVSEHGWSGFEHCMEAMLAWDDDSNARGHAVRACCVRKLPANVLNVIHAGFLNGLAESGMQGFSDSYVAYMKSELSLVGT